MKTQPNSNVHQFNKTWLPLLSNLHKDKKYYYHHQDRQNSLKHDLDSIISSLAQTPFSYTIKQGQMQRSYIAKKIQNSQKRLVKRASQTPSHPLMHSQIKSIKQQIQKYTQKLGKPQIGIQNDYAQFIKLSRQSQDYLEYYLKNHFKQTDFQILQTAQKSVILSQLKNSYPCLTDNPPQIVTRILLGLDINPLNDFHLVPWTNFSRFRRLACLTYTKSQGRKFLVNYMMAKRSKLSIDEFWAMIGAIIRKLEKVINTRNVQRLTQRVRQLNDKWIPEQLDKQSLQNLLITNQFFLTDELLQLIFII